jgi:tetratricopeptide (TPR) repeat protein
MTHFGPPYALPRNPEELRRLCLKLLRRHWQLPGLERFQEASDRELGIDLLEVSGRPRLSAARCDLRELREPPGLVDLRKAVERAASLALPIGHLTIATTVWRSKALKSAVFELNLENRAANLFTVELLCWDDIEELLDEYPEVLTEFEASPKRQALSKANSEFKLEPRWMRLPGANDEASRAITEAAALIEQHHPQLARLKLMQLRERSWEQLGLAQRMAVLSTLARAWLKEGEIRKAAMLFIAARSMRPDDEDACTNEVLAYELLGEAERACAMAQGVCAKFLKSGRAHALLLNNLPASMPLAELERKTPALLKMDPEVAVVMARRSIAANDYSRAERFARRASEAMGGKSDPWLLLGQAILLDEIESNSGPVREERVREAEACFTRAIALAQEELSIGNEVQALLARAQARIAVRDIEGAGRDIENAHSLERDDANGLCEYAILLRARGNLSGAIDVFRRAVKVGGRDDAEFHLGVTLRERDLAGDLSEAAEILIRSILNPAAIPSGDYLFAVGCACDVLSRLERWHQAEALLSELQPDRIPGAARFTLRARLELSRGETAKASRLADDALADLRMETSADERRNLAVLLHDLGRYAEALVIWESIIQIRGFATEGDTPHLGATSSDVRRLLECATRLGRNDLVLEVCRKLRVDGALVEGAFAFELEMLERHDLAGAIDLLDQYLTVHPGDRVMRLRRMAAAHTLGHHEQAIDPALMPPAREVLPALGRVAVKLMREADHPNDALSYAYELLRRNPADPDAHRAFLSALGPLGAMPTVPDFETAQPGCAVCFTEQDGSAETWAILEDAPNADSSRGEYGPSSAMMKQMRGRRLGDKFQLSEGRGSRKSAVVTQLISKYAYRYQDCLYGWARRFPGLPEIEMVRADAHPAAEAPYDLGGVAQGMSSEEVRDNAHKIYALTPLSIRGYGERVGLNDLHSVFSLASRPDAIIKCCEGSEEELEAALTAGNRANSMVLDLTAIATLCLLGGLDLLKTWARRFIVSPATLHVMRRFQFEPNPALAGTLNRIGSDLESVDLELRGLADLIASICTVGDGGGLSTLTSNQREELSARFGLHGAESILLASMPGHVLWTDDRVLANVACNEFGVRRVWTQAALMARVQAGNLEPAQLATACTKLAGWGYTFTTPSLETLMRAGALAGWSANHFPLKQALDQFATARVAMPDAVILAAELIVHIYADTRLRPTRNALIARLLDRLAARPGGREAIEALPRSLPIRFGLDVIGARELADAIRGWMSRSNGVRQAFSPSEATEEHTAGA